MSRWMVAHWDCDWCKNDAQDSNTTDIWDTVPLGWKVIDNRDVCDECAEAFEDFKRRREPCAPTGGAERAIMDSANR